MLDISFKIGRDVKFYEPIYENLPFIYFFMSAFLLAYDTSWLMIASAGLFYCAGSVTLVVRSSYRRLDVNKNNKKRIPEMIYEYLPYIYHGIAILLLIKTTSSSLQFLAFILMILAFRNLLCRKNNRAKKSSLF
ncbi:MAG: hypothetical protein ACI9LM_002906 [Alteromonadaceae bacterium]